MRQQVGLEPGVLDVVPNPARGVGEHPKRDLVGVRHRRQPAGDRVVEADPVLIGQLHQHHVHESDAHRTGAEAHVGGGRHAGQTDHPVPAAVTHEPAVRH